MNEMNYYKPSMVVDEFDGEITSEVFSSGIVVFLIPIILVLIPTPVY
jgi:hypothetical protein